MRYAFILLAVLALGDGILGEELSKGNRHDLHEYVLQDEVGAVRIGIGAGQDANAPNEEGHLALVTAVKTKNIEIATFLLTYSANASISEPISGTSAIVAAFAEGDAQMSRLLLKYGADPDIEDGNGATARSVVPDDAEFVEMLEGYDARGPMAFEDPPGSWTAHIAEEYDGATYYFNNGTNEVTYQKPPSCAWMKATVEGHNLYFNAITRQTTWRRPDALAWRKLADEETGNEFWYNYRTEATVSRTPAELSGDLLTEMDAEAGTYWYNPVTGKHSWENPSEESWQKGYHAASGNHFYFHHEKGSTWEAPEDHSWEEHKSSEHNLPFYHSRVLGESQWEKPAALSWIKSTLLNGQALSDEL
ncbi:hypothetical protein BSKO_08099 [Bryopsis sp. KO-2023]|nr:hypothetical protein BSKO_08099 [Bryopsis sp. KO-2023]